jgi:hypothetical protein
MNSSNDDDEALGGDAILLLPVVVPPSLPEAAVVVRERRTFCDRECRGRGASFCCCYFLVVVTMIFPTYVQQINLHLVHHDHSCADRAALSGVL